MNNNKSANKLQNYRGNIVGNSIQVFCQRKKFKAHYTEYSQSCGFPTFVRSDK